MERIGSSVIEILSVLLLRKRPALLVAALAIGAVFIPIPDKEANAVVERTSSLPKTITAASYKPDDGTYALMLSVCCCQFRVVFQKVTSLALHSLS